MHIVLTQRDLEKLSPATREELQVLLFGRAYDVEELAPKDAPPQFEVVEPVGGGAEPWEPSFPQADAKIVVETDVEQTRKLLANLSPKSIETLKRFAYGGNVPLESLIGEGGPYESFNDLKRSFVGAVNRRLRTVTKNRTAVLFRKTTSPGGDVISVRELTARSLHSILLETKVTD